MYEQVYGLINNPVDTGRKLNVHKTFRGRPGRLLNILCMFKLRPVSTENIQDLFNIQLLQKEQGSALFVFTCVYTLLIQC